MMIDSLEMTDADRARHRRQVCRVSRDAQIVVTHGTDTMVETARALAEGVTGKTVVLTGAMIPYAFGSSDGLFNLGSALSFAQVLPPGVYIAMNGHVLSVGSRAEEHADGCLRASVSTKAGLKTRRSRPRPPGSVEGVSLGRIQEIVLARRLVAGESCRVGDLREVTNLVQQDVRGELAARHRERAARDGEGHPLTCGLLVQPAEISAKVGASRIGIGQEALPVARGNACLVRKLTALHAREMTTLDEEHVIEHVSHRREAATPLERNGQSRTGRRRSTFAICLAPDPSRPSRLPAPTRYSFAQRLLNRHRADHSEIQGTDAGFDDFAVPDDDHEESLRLDVGRRRLLSTASAVTACRFLTYSAK